ncbi:hypothetical protein L1049_007032 [Liquidambar formosana]|uniref:Uncharacterized protein n=1 Tax=Liquidambar formosana TaxID=63359 RepID=A0AAP0RI35_LIQFO
MIHHVKFYDDTIEATWAEEIFVGLECKYFAIIQLCVDRRCLIFPLHHVDKFPDSVSTLLKNRRFTFVGINVERDADLLFILYKLSLGGIYMNKKLLTDGAWESPDHSDRENESMFDEDGNMYMSDIGSPEWEVAGPESPLIYSD